MKVWKFLVLLILLIYSGWYYIILTIENEDNDFIFAGFVISFFAILFLIISAISLRIEYKLFLKRQSLITFKLTSCSAIIFLIACGVQIFLSCRDLSNVTLDAGQDLDFNFIRLELREDETYKFTNGSGLGSSYFRGKYSREDSIITIDTVGADKFLKSDKLAIRDNRIFMIDSKHKIVDSLFYFNIFK